MIPENLSVHVDGQDITYQISIDPDQMDLIIASELRRCYEGLATNPIQWEERERTMEAILVVLEHYMTQSDYNEWYETIKEL